METAARTMKGKRERLEVIIYTQFHKIVGTVHTMPASRLVDFLNAKAPDLFMVVTDAEVYGLPEEYLLQVADFFAINRKAIMMVFPRAPSDPCKTGGH